MGNAPDCKAMQAPEDSRAPQFMLVPSLECPGACSYCFGPNNGPRMDEATTVAAIDWIGKVLDSRPEGDARITFHGGEPLTWGLLAWRTALPRLTQMLCGRRSGLTLQSNLWLLDDDHCALFKEFRVALGTSLSSRHTSLSAQVQPLPGIRGSFRRRDEGHGRGCGCQGDRRGSGRRLPQGCRHRRRLDKHTGLPARPLSAGRRGSIRAEVAYQRYLQLAPRGRCAADPRAVLKSL
jgi:hypothetical protein